MKGWHRTAGGVALAALTCLAAATVGASLILPDGLVTAPADFPHWRLVQAMAHWDAGWYADIARDGYWYDPARQGPVAFFPAYPLLIRALAWLGLNRWVAGIAITLVCGPLAVVLFFRWAKQHVGEETASLAALVLTLYPFAIYLYGIVYSDALFLALAVAAFLALEKGRPGWATVLGACATACRPVAPAVVLGLLARSIEMRRARGEPLRAWDVVPALSGLGLLVYMTFLYARFGDPLAFAHVQSAPLWDGGPGPHTWFKVTWFEILSTTTRPLVVARLGGHALVTFGALALVPLTWKRLGWGYGLYVAIAVGLPAVSSKDFQGLGRYVLAAFPIFLTLAQLLEPHRRLRLAWLSLSAAILVLLAAGFGGGGYVA